MLQRLRKLAHRPKPTQADQRESRPRLNRLSAVPVVNDAVEAQQRGESLVLWTAVRKRWFNSPPFSWALPYRDKRGVGLDPLGREVYQMIDGQRTTEQIIDRFAVNHKLHFHEARQSVLAFLRMLVERNLVVIAVTEAEHKRGADETD